MDTLRSTVSKVDAVIHTAFNHDFSKFAENAEQDHRAIEAMGLALKGSDRPLVVTSGFSRLPNRATEADLSKQTWIRQSKQVARVVAESGVRVATVRLAPSVHGIGDYGYVPMLIKMAKERGVSAYLNEGKNCWAAVHRSDAACLYRLILELSATEPVYHAAAEGVVPFKAIAEMIGKHLGVPVEPRDEAYFGWFASVVGAEMSASSDQTRRWLGG